mgnify:CR=1 FL=1
MVLFLTTMTYPVILFWYIVLTMKHTSTVYSYQWMLERKGTKMFKFIENAVADHRIRKIESELERDNVTMSDIYELNTAMKLTKEGMNAGEAIDMAAEMRANAECIEAE